ncbi:TlpA family protein disulfide reductase [bacterium]|nr:TlpA family protein disulfide reductase [bacterium]
MARVAIGLVAACFLAGVGAGQDGQAPGSPAEQLKRLRTQADDIEATFLKELRADRSSDGVTKANDNHHRAIQEWRKTALAALRKSGDLPDAFPVIEAVLDGSSVELVEMADLLRRHHAANPALGKVFHGMVQDHQEHGRAFVEEMAEKSPVAAVRGQAAFELGWQAKWRITQDGVRGLGFGTKLTDAGREAQTARAEKYLTRATTAGDAPMAYGKGTVAAHARAELAGLKNLATLRVGKAAPDIVGETVEGAKFKLSDTRGKVTVVVFWATWCGPCMRMVPHEKKLVERLQGRPFALVGVNGDDDRVKARDAARDKGMTWPSFWSGVDGADGPIARAWNVHTWPTVYVLDARGVIRFTGHGDAKLDEWVDELLAEVGNGARGR